MTTTTTTLHFVRFGRAKSLDHLLVGERTACGLAIPSTAVHLNRLQHPCPKCSDADPQRGEIVEHLLDYLFQHQHFSRIGAEHGGSRLLAHRQLTPWDFDGAEPIMGRQPDLDMHVHPDDVGWPLDVRFLMMDPIDEMQQLLQVAGLTRAELRTLLASPTALKDYLDAHPELEASRGRDGPLQLHRLRSARPQLYRGRVRQLLSYPAEWAMADPARGRGTAQLVGRAGPETWRVMYQHGLASPLEVVDVSEFVQKLLGYAARRKRQWRVYLGIDDRPGLDFPTTPRGAAEVFRLRDIPDGKQRRLALKHWCEEHWRPTPTDEDEEYLVRAHLRGAEKFQWGSLRGRITPSDTDLARADAAKIAREAARQEGTDRRPRAHDDKER